MKKKASVKADKSLNDWVLAIYCDYGVAGTKRAIRFSYSKESGEKAWIKFKKMFAQYHCWQEDRKGNIVQDSRQEITT